ncbi:glycoside hydrolase family 25 protein [Hydnomerulius pinastri MD-312]|nr:glycoside hydrolase family 25 protein [Hydnomerulius pinastri MD-312]
MKFFTAFVLLAATLVGASPVEKRSEPFGIDVSSNQGSVNWSSWKSKGVTFAYIKATEGVSYVNPDFNAQHAGATKAGMIRGGYHFARPNDGAGSTQASYFLRHGGGWSGDGKTLPGALDIEYNPTKGGNECYGLGHSSMVSWVKSFSNEYHSKTGRYPIIYTTTDWWKSCTGNSASFASTSPLWIAHPGSIGPLPAGWRSAAIWQYGTESHTDVNKFIGNAAGLKK